MIRSRLTAKIALLIVLVLIIGFGASTILTIRRESNLLVEQSKVATRRLTDALIASIETAMLQERPDVTRRLIYDLKAASPVEALDIYRRNGVEAFTDLATLEEVQRNAGLAAAVRENITQMRREPGQRITAPLFTRAVETLETQESLEYRDGVPLFTVHRPILNRAKCQGCHGSDHQVRAVVRVATSMAPLFAEVARQRNWQILIGLLTISTAGGVLAVAMRYVVVRPIQELAQVAGRIGAGDLEARATVPTSDEIGELGRALNEMTTRLARGHDDLAARNTELATALESLQASRRQVQLLEQLKGELSKFVPDAVKQLLERDPAATELEKRLEAVSVLFLDIAGYTRLSEQVDPKRLNQVVQSYFSSFLEIIRAHHGDVNETAGDGLMVIFQEAGPGRSDFERQDHALNAARAALGVQQRTRELNDEHRGTGHPIELHLGVNTGEALVGATKLGGPGSQRWTFTATGAVTNVAARLAGISSGGDIVVGQVTAERIRHEFVLEALGEQTLKNVSEPIRVYRLIPPGVYDKVV
jgi:class 3 adenylate cyclase/HAMP domain-containing protein